MVRVLVTLLRTDGQSPLLPCCGRMCRVLVTLLWTDGQSPCCLAADGCSESLLPCCGRMVRVLVALLRTDVQSPCYLTTDGYSESLLTCYGRMIRVPFTTGGRMFRAPDIRKDLFEKSSTILIHVLKRSLPLSSTPNCRLAGNSCLTCLMLPLNTTFTRKDTTNNVVLQM
jgi:hypothetical protein